MTALLSLAILVLIAFIGSFLYKKIKITAFWLKGIVYSGIFYIGLGYVLGPSVLKIVSEPIFNELNVLFTLVLGWAGFLTGLQLSIKGLKRFPEKYYGEVTVGYLCILVSLTGLLWLANNFFSLLPVAFRDIAFFAVLGTISSPIMLGVLVQEYRLPGKLSYRLQFNSAFDNILGVVTGGLVFVVALLATRHEGTAVSAIKIAFPYLVVVAAVFLYNYIYETMKSRQEKFLLFISLLILTIGTAYFFSQSILLISFLFGFGLANSKISSRKLYRDIQELEKPLYILLLIFAGINLKIYSDKNIFIFLIIFFFLRVALKYLTERLVGGLFEKEEHSHSSMGLSGIGMGGLSLAMALDYLIIYNSEAASVFLFVVIVSLIPNDVLLIEYLKKKLLTSDMDAR